MYNPGRAMRRDPFRQQQLSGAFGPRQAAFVGNGRDMASVGLQAAVQGPQGRMDRAFQSGRNARPAVNYGTGTMGMQQRQQQDMRSRAQLASQRVGNPNQRVSRIGAGTKGAFAPDMDRLRRTTTPTQGQRVDNTMVQGAMAQQGAMLRKRAFGA